MRIVDIRELTVRLEGNIANSMVSFAEHTVSLVAVVTDVVRDGRPMIGLAFDSIGRFAQGGILRDRIIQRVLAATPESLLDATGTRLDPARVMAAARKNEKPGGHGDRAAAIAAIELAIWDLNAKLDDEPAYATIARWDGRAPLTDVDVYAAGGYYYDPGQGRTLRDELNAYRDMGFDAFKMKIGGAPLTRDLERIHEAIGIAGAASRVAVDANGRFERVMAFTYADAIQPLGLRWFEEIGDPLDYALNAEIASRYDGTIATGENLFSYEDSLNLLNFGGMRTGRDVFQMDAGLAYGLGEYRRIVELIESRGHERRQAYPHGGHLINLHIVLGLGLGGCEAYPGVFQPFGGYAPECKVEHHRIRASDAPGFGLEQKRELVPFIESLIGDLRAG